MKHMSRIVLAIFIGSGLWVPASAGSDRIAQDPEVQFQRAVQLETVDGDLNAAIDLYKQVVTNNGNNRAIAAKALLRLGGCYEKQGNAEASKAYEQLLRDYADQAKSAAEARTRLAAMRKSAVDESGLSTRRVWAGPKTDCSGSISPDGKYLSFVDWETGDLAVRDLDKGTNRRFTNKGSWESSEDEAGSSIWSPDGKQVAYHWFQWSTEPAGAELRLISLDSPTPRTLYRCENTQEWIDPFDWSPDGKQILAVLSKEDGNQEMELVSVADGKVRTLKRLPQSVEGLAGAAISPDGRYVLYDYKQSESSLAHDIFLLPIAGGSETPLIEYPADDLVLGWAPDGNWILFTSDRRGSVDLWAIRLENGKPQGAPLMVKPEVGLIAPLGLTRSGSFYFGVGGASNNVYVVKLDPLSGALIDPPAKLVKHSEGFNRSPRYSPDGRHLAYVSKRVKGVASAGTGWGDTLCIRSLETTEEREYQREIIRVGARGFCCPRWAPDGKSILLFGLDNRARYSIYHLDLETGRALNALRSSRDLFIGLPAGWRDETSFVYQRIDKKSDRGEICVRDLRNGSEKVLFGTSPPVNGAPYVSPDRQWVSVTESYESGERALRIISTESGDLRRLIKFTQEEQPDRIRHAWSADSKYVLYIKRSQDRSKFEVWRVPIDGGQPQETGLEMKGTIDHMSAHPDGEHLAFENREPRSVSASSEEVWVMENFLPLIKAGQK